MDCCRKDGKELVKTGVLLGTEDIELVGIDTAFALTPLSISETSSWRATEELRLTSTKDSSTMASLRLWYSSSKGDEGLDLEVDLMETDEVSDAAEDSELTLEMLMMLALVDPGAVVKTGAGGNGNIVNVFGACVGGDDELLDEEFSDKVTFFKFVLAIILLPLSLSLGSWLT